MNDIQQKCSVRMGDVKVAQMDTGESFGAGNILGNQMAGQFTNPDGGKFLFRWLPPHPTFILSLHCSITYNFLNKKCRYYLQIFFDILLSIKK